MEFFRLFLLIPEIGNLQGDFGIQKRQFAEPFCQRIELVCAILKNGVVG